MADLEALKRICEEHELKLLEDACQAIGGTYAGKPLGSYGDIGCFSFDYVKTITCGEGGGLITDNKEYYVRADQYSDHGHDHIGSDRGAESHPYLGYNFRISELNAAVGVAQIHRLDDFLAIQERNYRTMRDALQGIAGVEFRRVPPTGVENYSFLNFFLPDETLARQVAAEFAKNDLDSCFYWYDNNWHYHRRWDHLKTGLAQFQLNTLQREYLSANAANTYLASDHWMSRTLSCLVKLGWTATEVRERAAKMRSILLEILQH